jgi:hypothetical protein
MSIHKKLSDAREHFHELELKKTGHNKFAGYKYFELGDFLIPALKVLKIYGIVSVISFGKEVATMKLIDIDKPDDFIEITSPMSSAALKGAHEIQNLGAVQTYLRRYLWVAALEIVEHDAIDSSPKTDEGMKVKGSGPVISPRGGIGEDLPNEIKEFLQEMASSVTELVKNGKAVEALAMIDEQQLEADQKVYLSNQMDAPTRSALKKVKNG